MNAFSNLPEMLEASCKKYWWRKAILAEDKTIRYSTLCKKVNKLAAAINERFDIEQNDNVAILLGNSGIYPIVYFSILKLGAVVVPINTFLKGEELKYILNNSGAELIVTSSEFYNIIWEIRPQLNSLQGVILIDKEPDIEDDVSLKMLLKNSSNNLPLRNISRNSTAVIIYTSGTTGYPKGAMLSHGNLLSNVESCIKVCSINQRDRVLLVLPMFHSFTMTVCMLMPLAIGAGIVISTTLHQFKKVFRRILLRGVTFLIGIPPLYSLLAKADIPWWIRFLLRIRMCISGAAPLPETTLIEFEKRWKIPLLEGYGLSETSPVASLNPVKGPRKPNSIGKPIPGVEIKIVGPNEEELGVGEIGELIIKGKNVMKGYYNDQKATDEAVRGGWMFTGDLGKIDKDGYIFIVDRKKDMILVRGLNVYPREVEQVIQECASVAEVSVVSKVDQNKGEVPVAFVVPKEGEKLNAVEIVKYCRQKLADYKVPRQVFIKEQLPRTPTGKILKRELRKMVQE